MSERKIERVFCFTLPPSTFKSVLHIIKLVCWAPTLLPQRVKRDLKIRDETVSRTRWPIKDWEQNTVICAGNVQLRSHCDERRRGCKTLFISVILQQFFRRNSHGIIQESLRNALFVSNRRDHRRRRALRSIQAD